MPELGAIRTALEAPAGRGHFRKKAIIGYTEHKARAPFLNLEWELGGLNDLYLDLPEIPDANKRLRWFQLHQWVEPVQHDQPPSVTNLSEGPIHPRDANHVAWMGTAAREIPVYLMNERPEVPDAVAFPHQQILDFFGVPYFTNSISWMMGLFIMEMVTPTELPDGRTIWYALPGAELGVFGVDMMVAGGVGSEYGWQRPSCEWLLGWAMGAGIKVTVPPESDLLASAFQYGEMKFGRFRRKIMSHGQEMVRRLNVVNQQLGQLQRAQAELQGAVNVTNWASNAWLPGDDGSEDATAPMPNAHKKQGLKLAGEVIHIPDEPVRFTAPGSSDGYDPDR